MARALTSDELNLLRADGQFTKLYLAVLTPNTIYTARLASLPDSFDNVHTISVTTESGTLSDVKPNMTAYVGTSAGAHDLGMVRIRKAPITGTWYIGLTSEITWQGSCYLTIVDDFDLWAKHAALADSALVMDVDVAYSDQHSAFNPVPVLGPHAVAKLEGASVDVQFGPPEGDESWVFDSTIESVLWEIPDAIAIDDDTAIRPIATFDTTGTHVAYCTVTAANGKSTTGVRKAYIWDDDHMPGTVFQLAQCQAEYETGGWMFDVNMEAEASLSEIRDRSLVILFAEDWYGFPPDQVKQSIGPIEGRENIVCVGRIVGQSIRWDREAGNVHFTVQGAHYWLNKIKGFPIQIQPATVAASWSQLAAMTTDRVLWHVLYWHSTVIETMDFYPPNDTRYVDQGTSMASSIWGQLVDIAFSKILASPGVDRFGRLFIEVDPNLTPEADRDWSTVMPLTDDDWQEGIDLQRVTVEDCSLIRLTTQLINSSGSGITLYSLSPGHTPRKYGEPEMLDRILASSQAESNSLAGLVLGARTNEIPDVPAILLENNRMFDLWPRQFAALTMAESDNPRGVGYDGNLIPRRVALYHDSEIQFMHPELNFEAETFEQLSVNGDIPDTNMDDLTLPPIVTIPGLDLPDIPIIIPGTTESTETGPKTVLFHETHGGMILAEHFDTTPVYRTINAGLTADQYVRINWMGVCPNGALYVARVGPNGSNGTFLARAPSVGGTFEVLYESPVDDSEDPDVLWAVGLNPLVSEQIAFVKGAWHGGADRKIYVGSYGAYTGGVAISPDLFITMNNGLSYGLGYWLLTYYNNFARISPDGSAIVGYGTPGIQPAHLRASTTGITYHEANGENYFLKGENNLASVSVVNTGNSIQIAAGTDRPISAACDPSGQFIMTRGSIAPICKSTDFGATFGAGGMPLVGDWAMGYAGANGTQPRFIAANYYVYYTPDFGATWESRGNSTLYDIYPFPAIDLVKVLVF